MHSPLTSPFTWQQTQAAGVTRFQLDAWIRNRVVRRVLHGVYAWTDVPDDVAMRIAALKLVLTPATVVTDRTAAWLHGVDTFAFRELEILPPTEVCVLPDANRIRRHGVRGRTRDVVPTDLVWLAGLPVTSPLRTALDLGCGLRRSEALAALDGFMRHHAISTPDLTSGAERFTGRRGVVQLRELAVVASADAESPGESWTRMAMLDAGLPRPQLQWWVTVRGVPTYRLDLAYPAHRLAIEYDGREFHESPEQQARDRERRRWLRDHGWTVIVVTKDDFSGVRLDRWLDDVRRALRLAA